MANYDREVYLTKIDYENKMRQTKKLFIEDKFNGIDNKTFALEIDKIWTVDHRFMERLIQEQTNKVRDENHVTMKEQQSLPNRFEMVPESRFKEEEKKYSTHIKRGYYSTQGNSTDYLTQTIKDFVDRERTIPYYPHGDKSQKPTSWHTPGEYLSMLFNVNMRVASWNQTIKDGQILGIDLVYLETHPNACEVCNYHMGKYYSISGRTYNIPNFAGSIDEAYKDGVGHPNCKCNFTLVWDLDEEHIDTATDNYEQVQKARALQRDIENYTTDKELYRYIENYEEADKTEGIIATLKAELKELLSFGDIAKYLYIDRNVLKL